MLIVQVVNAGLVENDDVYQSYECVPHTGSGVVMRCDSCVDFGVI